MLTLEENELLTRTGPGSPMGDLLRRFWLPFLLPEELPAPDCPPVRVRLMGEELVAFRDTSGRIGLLDSHCPHRLASLFFGRNEENGLRCVYHGWKYDVEGRCVDMPSEPPESSFKEKIRTTAYPVRERGGLIWAYLGPRDLMPEMPELEWARVPESHRLVSKRLQECNFAQAVEGGIDSSHVSFLHSRLRSDEPDNLDSSGMIRVEYMANDRSPRFFVRETDYGLLIAARRNAEATSYYWRLTQFLMPFYTMIPGTPGYPIGGHAWVPIDDERCWNFSVTWRHDRPLSEEELSYQNSGLGIHAYVEPGSYRPLRNKENDYLIDREKQRTRTYTGIEGIGEQDMAVQESSGTIADRSREHLGSSDAAIIAMRRRLTGAAIALREGTEPPEASQPDAYKVRSAAVVLDRNVDFAEGARQETRSIP
ncbi:MAG: aromatic ring-hydroxylating dioxygenase subunit alpha [Chloroflexi bacterium]|nr:aromatic ring-hydroxylating dioxygenase subunit alpha [Chloroflexota bacterium]